MSVFKRYKQIGEVKTAKGVLPVLEVPQMTDERWQELARENAVINYRRKHGQDPESTEQAVAWQRELIGQVVAE